MVLDADLMGAMGTKPFAKSYPDQTVDCGIQEANMVGVACGLSAAGKIPFAHTFAAVYDTPRLRSDFYVGSLCKNECQAGRLRPWNYRTA